MLFRNQFLVTKWNSY